MQGVESISKRQVAWRLVHITCAAITVLLGLAQCRPGLTNWACSGQAQAALDGNTCAVYPAPKDCLLSV